MDYTANAAAADRLGPIVMACRPRPLKHTAYSLGFMGGYWFWIGPVLCALLAMFLTFPLVGVAIANQVPPPLLAHRVWGPAMAVWWLACFVFLLWYMYVLPRRDYLVLHERGFRCRISHRRWEVPLGKLKEFRLGEEPGGSRRVVHAILSLRYPLLYGFLQKATATKVHLVFKSGKRASIPTFLVRFEPDDLRGFFRYLVDHYPQLFKDA